MIIRTRTRCDKNLLENSRIRMIATATIGFDHIDLEYCRRNGIEVATAAGCNSRGVLQWVSSVLAKLSEQDGWLPTQRTLGVVGVGHIGSLVAEYASSWGFRVLCCDPPRQRAEKERLLSEGRNEADGATAGFVPFETLAAQSDIITFHVPLQREGDDATWHITDKAFSRSSNPAPRSSTPRAERWSTTRFCAKLSRLDGAVHVSTSGSMNPTSTGGCSHLPSFRPPTSPATRPRARQMPQQWPWQP